MLASVILWLFDIYLTYHVRPTTLSNFLFIQVVRITRVKPIYDYFYNDFTRVDYLLNGHISTRRTYQNWRALLNLVKFYISLWKKDYSRVIWHACAHIRYTVHRLIHFQVRFGALYGYIDIKLEEIHLKPRFLSITCNFRNSCQPGSAKDHTLLPALAD